VAEAELARVVRVGDVQGERGDRVFIHRLVEIDDKQRVPHAVQPLDDLFLIPGEVEKCVQRVESSNAIRCQRRHTHVTWTQPENATRWKIRARTSAGRMKIGTRLQYWPVLVA